MSNVLEFRAPRKIHEEACAWIARIDAGLSAEDKEALDAWLAASSDHRKALLELSGLWDEMDILGELSELFPLKQPLKAPAERRGKRFAWGRASLVAAALSGVAMMALWSFDRDADEEAVGERLASAGRYETAVGQQSTVQLSDGSVLSMNTDTELLVRYSGTERAVVLTHGEATFDVANDAQRPFAVYAGRRVVQAVGTVFNVELSRGDGLEVSVTEGRVRVLRRSDGPVTGSYGLDSPGDGSLILDSVVGAGQAVTVEGGVSALRHLAPEDIDVELAWQRGMLIFRGERLDAVLQEFARYTTVDFELADEALKSVRVGGYFRAGEVDGLLLALRENFGIQSRRDGERILLLAN